MNEKIIYILIFVLGVIISSFAQILLKKSTNIKKENFLKEYLNIKTIAAYSIFFLATLCTVFSYKFLPLSYGPVLGTLEYLFITILSYYLLNENVKKKKLLGLIIIIIGVFLYSI